MISLARCTLVTLAVVLLVVCWATNHNGADAWSNGPAPKKEFFKDDAAAITPTRRQFFVQSALTFLTTQQAWAVTAAEEDEGTLPSPTVDPIEFAKEPESNVLADAPDELLIRDENEVMEEIGLEENRERQASEDTNKLISELEDQIKKEKEMEEDPSKASVFQDEEKRMEQTKNLIDTLEKEEEKIELEAKELISKLETLEKAEEQLQQTQQDSSPSIAETKEFLNKVKERVEEKEDLIARLKRESQKDVDPKTGKFKPMNPGDFKARVPSDFDFLQFLKESVSNNNEFERDMEAFKGLLEKNFGPMVEQLKNAESRLGPVVDEVRRTATPMMESAVDEVRRAATPMLESAFDEVRKTR